MSIRVRSPADFLPEIERMVGNPISIYRFANNRRIPPDKLEPRLRELSGDFGVRIKGRPKALGNLRYVRLPDGEYHLQYRGIGGYLEAVCTSSEDAA
ncbi:MAG: hypothetical protein HY368_01645 [Candidatus Aenigmarchaeota archaeon]|nr:hypothetical protein [Candidatus Aenigmarchaeota archaeon]